MGSAHSAGHALVILVWSLAGRGEASPLEVEARSGPKGLWAKLDDRRQPGIVSAWRCVFPLSGVLTSGARLVQRGVVGMTQFSQVVAGWTLLNTKDLVGHAQ